jgi:hypothetical protein
MTKKAASKPAQSVPLTPAEAAPPAVNPHEQLDIIQQICLSQLTMNFANFQKLLNGFQVVREALPKKTA